MGNEQDADGDPKLLEYKATGAEGAGHEVYNVIQSQQKLDDIVKSRKAPAKPAAIEDEDEAWAKAFDNDLERMREKSGKDKKDKKSLKKDKKDLKEMMKEAKRLKKEAKEMKKTKKDDKKTKKAKKGKTAKEESSSSSSSS